MSPRHPSRTTADAVTRHPDAAVVGMLRVDPALKIVSANDAFVEIVDRSREALIGLDLAVLTQVDEEPDEQAARLGELLAGERECFHQEMRYALPDDGHIWVDVAASAVRDANGALLEVVLMVFDIDQRKSEEARLLQRHGLALQVAGLGTWQWWVQDGRAQFDMFWAMTVGYAVTELVPSIDTWRSLMHPDDLAGAEASVMPCLHGDAPQASHEHRLRHRDGHWVWLLQNGVVIERDSKGRPYLMLGTSQDITQRKMAEAALEQSRQRQALALRAARLGQYDWNVELDEMTFDWRFADIVGYELSELPRDRAVWQMLDHPDDVARIHAELMDHLEGRTESYRIEYRMIHKQGHVVWVHATGMVVERDGRGRPLRVVGLHNDVTEQKKSEEELRAAIASAESANRAKSQFLANMSHEIRTPMNAMIGLTHLVLDTALAPRQRDLLQKVHGASKSLLTILNDVLDYSKIEAGRMAIEHVQFTLEEPLNNVSNLFGAEVEHKGLELFFEVSPGVPLEVVGDPLRLTQVISNLIGNAIKFTERGQIHLKVEVAAREADELTLRFAITDTGIGMSQEQLGRLFQAFTQADNSVTRKYGGTGLGLTISQQLVGLMGGTLGVSSALGGGCTFTFTVRVGTVATPHASLDLHRLKGLRTLVVDDQETSLAILQNLLQAWGLEVETASSAAEGLQCIDRRKAAEPFDVVLLDWRMPGMSGLEMARVLRERAPEGGVPFAIMVTAHGREQLIQEAGDIALDVVLTKPVVPSHLFDILMRLRHGDSAPVGVQAGSAQAPLRRFDGARVLLVEDNLLNQQVASGFLEGLGVAVTLACHGGEAVQLAEAGRFDLVLMDLHMPVMDGLEATRRIKEGAARELPIVAMTAAVMSEDRERCEAAGMNGFLAKPVDPDELVRTLCRWLPSPPVAAETPLPVIDAVAVSPLPAIAGFDAQGALRRLHGDQDRLNYLLRSFASQYRALSSGLVGLLAESGHEEALMQLHTLKGTAATLGLSDLSARAAALETRVRAAEGPVGCESLARGLEEAIAAIDRLEAEGALDELAQPGGLPSAAPTAGGQDLADFLDRTRRYLLEQELMPEELMAELEQFASGAAPGSPLHSLRQHILDFDHEAALADVDALALALTIDFGIFEL